MNGQAVQQDKLLRPGDEIAIANRRYRIQYTLPPGRGFLVEAEDIDVPLLEKAGLARSTRTPPPETRSPLFPRTEDEDSGERFV